MQSPILQAINMVIHKVIHNLWITSTLYGPRGASAAENSGLLRLDGEHMGGYALWINVDLQHFSIAKSGESGRCEGGLVPGIAGWRCLVRIYSGDQFV
jgi:hypothetical protein